LLFNFKLTLSVVALAGIAGCVIGVMQCPAIDLSPRIIQPAGQLLSTDPEASEHRSNYPAAAALAVGSKKQKNGRFDARTKHP